MVNTKPASEWASNYAAAAGRAATEYGKGINRTTDFLAKAKAGQQNYVTAMQDPKTLARRDANLDSAAEQKWKANAAGKGQANIARGMQGAQQEVAAAAQTSAAALQSLTLQPRSVTDWESNYERSKQVGRALKTAHGR